MFKSYAQEGEDITINRLLGYQKTGFYVDVGAFDPVQLSVTKTFYDKGWSGINIEPNPRFYKRLVEQRERDINLQAGVSDSVGFAKLFDEQEGPGSTMIRKYVNDPDHSPAYEVQTFPLAKMLADHISDQDIDFMKIDVEGMEKTVLESNDWGVYRPRLLCIEATEPFSNQASYHAWEWILLENGYRHVTSDRYNRYYLLGSNITIWERLEKILRFCDNTFKSISLPFYKLRKMYWNRHKYINKDTVRGLLKRFLP